MRRTHQPLMRCTRSPGLTLVELLVVLVIMGVLAAIVLPNYQQSLYKGRRPEAMTALATIQQAQERWRGNNTSYQSTLADLPGASAATSASGWYALSIVSASAGAYVLRATAVSGTKQANDSNCQTLEVELAGGTLTYRSFNSGGSQNATPDPCWVK